MPPFTPATPRFFTHSVELDIIRRRAVYHWPPESPELIQRRVQKKIADLKSDGYEQEVINRILRSLSELTLHEAEQYAVNISRAVFFAELINLEIL